MNSIIEAPANRRVRRFVPAALACFVLAACQSRPAEGDYVTFVREIMAESAALDREVGDGPDRAEQVERSVRVWRGEEQDD